jgi:hypothetical protein
MWRNDWLASMLRRIRRLCLGVIEDAVAAERIADECQPLKGQEHIGVSQPPAPEGRCER